MNSIRLNEAEKQRCYRLKSIVMHTQFGLQRADDPIASYDARTLYAQVIHAAGPTDSDADLAIAYLLKRVKLLEGAADQARIVAAVNRVVSSRYGDDGTNSFDDIFILSSSQDITRFAMHAYGNTSIQLDVAEIKALLRGQTIGNVVHHEYTNMMSLSADALAYVATLNEEPFNRR